jgi:polysaccharide biosynthesis protein PslG
MMAVLQRRATATLAVACCMMIALVPPAAAKGMRADGASSHRAAPLRGINLGGIGAGTQLSTIDSEIAIAQRLHARLVRVEMPWAEFEPLAAGQIDPSTQAVADRLFKDAAGARIKVIALLDRTPCWASSAPSSILNGCVAGEDIGGAHAWPPRNAASFASFTAWLAKRYGSGLAAIEVWNEPDQANQAYLAGPSKPQRYAEMLRAAYPAIKKANPRVQVLAGSLVGSNGAFMNALYKVGIKGYYDGVAVHFYTLTLGSLRVFRQDQLAHGDRKPLWLDEFGWSSCWPKEKLQAEQGCVTQAVQAQNLANMVRQLAHTNWIAAETSYDIQDSPEEDFGVLDLEGKPKPSFSALSKAFASPLAPPSPVTLKLHAKKGQVIASGSGPVGDYLKLEAFQHGRLRYHAIFTLDRFNDYTIKLPKVLGTHGLTVRVYQYWLGRGHDAQRSI